MLSLDQVRPGLGRVYLLGATSHLEGDLFWKQFARGGRYRHGPCPRSIR